MRSSLLKTFAVFFFVGQVGCATHKPLGNQGDTQVVEVADQTPPLYEEEVEPGVERSSVVADNQSKNISQKPSVFSGAHAELPPEAKMLIERPDLKAVDSVKINLSRVDAFISSDSSQKYGKLRVHLLQGEMSECGVSVLDDDKKLGISEEKSGAGACRYWVEIVLKEAASLNIEADKGLLTIEHWSKPVEVKLGSGDIGVGQLAKLSVQCGYCILTGENVQGPLSYKMDSGNVGITGLGGSVEGATLGDTVLKWSKVRLDTQVKVTSLAGDVALFFPSGVGLAMDLHAPRGDISSREISGERGIPVSVMAKQGNVRLYRITP